MKRLKAKGKRLKGPTLTEAEKEQVLSGRKEAQEAQKLQHRDYACLTEFVMRMAATPCERWIAPHTCLNELDADPCWPCQAMALERQLIFREGEPRCRVCGCIDGVACFNYETNTTCGWAKPDLCTQCAAVLKEKEGA